MDVSLHRAEHHHALSEPLDLSINGSRYATAAFIVSADCRTNGSCICPEANSSPTVFIPERRMSLMIPSGLCPAFSASSSSLSMPTFCRQ